MGRSRPLLSAMNGSRLPERVPGTAAVSDPWIHVPITSTAKFRALFGHGVSPQRNIQRSGSDGQVSATSSYPRIAKLDSDSGRRHRRGSYASTEAQPPLMDESREFEINSVV